MVFSGGFWGYSEILGVVGGSCRKKIGLLRSMGIFGVFGVART
jgi:hypothetical protein